VCKLPRRVEVAAIKRDQRTRRFLDRVRLIRQRLTAGVRKSRCEPANRFELADQYSGRRHRGLTDLIERELGEPIEAHRRHPYPEAAGSVVPVSFERGPFGSSASRSASRHFRKSSSPLLRSGRTRLWNACANVAYGMSRLYWPNLPDKPFGWFALADMR
jgi:hypothetical protein